MNGGKSDASTSTDDAKDRPLCLYYFTHPFGVLSPEPPSVSVAPPPGCVARAFLDMQPLPLPPFYWPPAPASPRSSSPSPGPGVAYELGNVRVHPHPVSVLSMAQSARRPAPPLSSPLSSPLSCSLSSSLWLEARAGAGFPRRTPCSRILPPLLLPSPRHLTDYSSDDIWPRKCLSSKFSLPPIEMPPPALAGEISIPGSWRREEPRVESVSVNVSGKEGKCKRKLGVNKAGRRGLGRGRVRDVRRMVTGLIQRAIAGRRWLQASSPSPALQRALSTIREAWAEPASLRQRCCVLSRMYARDSALELENTIEGDSERESGWSAMGGGALLERAPRGDASPGLLRRRYSVPETIMRKYRLAQQISDSEEIGTFGTGCSAACPSTPRSAGESPRHLRRDRELMRKSTLLRRMWARPPVLSHAPAPPVCCCELGGSPDELLSLSPPPRRPSPSSPSTYAETAYALSERYASAEVSPQRAPAAPLDRSYDSSDTFSNSMSTAKETPCSSELARASECERERPPAGRETAAQPCREGEDRNGNALASERLVCDGQGAAPYEVLEIIVSESASSTPPDERHPRPAPLVRPPPPADRNVNIDEYVSRVLVESLNSLTDRLEGMNAAVPAARKLSVVEKEIKVRLQNAAVNTIVHLSPTSNHQIIFGNEELYERKAPPLCALSPPEPRDECNNPRARSPRHNNNASRSASPTPTPTPTPTPRADAFDAIIQHDSVNRTVLHQIQKLFRGELLHEGSESGLREEISNVDVFLSGAGADTISVSTRGADTGTDYPPGPGSGPGSDSELGVGAGSCYRELTRDALVPRRFALPHSASMEVNTSEEEEEPDPLGSDAASLVDSLDDPASPRAPLRRCAPRPALHLLPERAPLPRPLSQPGEAFFVRIREDATPEGARVSEYMPERIRQKLVRRHRRREMRAECARRSKVRRLKEELQAARVPPAPTSAPASASASACVQHLRAQRMDDAGSHENLDRRNGRRDQVSSRDRERTRGGTQDARRRRPDGDERSRSRRSEKHQVRGKLVARPALATVERPPHRIYQKSEIREGDKCIEILEILEYSRSSTDSSPPEESGVRLPQRRSRIPVPVPGPGSTTEPTRHMRLTGGDAPLARLLLRAFTPASQAPPPPPEPRPRANSLRFKRVFDMIPEERPSLSVDSSADAEEVENAPEASDSPPAPSPPTEVQRRVATRSAGTSPPGEARLVRSQTTMTSPSSKSAATSPWRPPIPAPPPPPPPRPPPPREGSREGCDPDRARAAMRRSGHTQYDGVRREARGGHSPAGGGGAGSAESSGESGGSLLCSLAPRWLSARRRRRARRSPPPSSPPQAGTGAGGWSVTVAGSCRAALPADVEMRLRFPRPTLARSPCPSPHTHGHSRASTNQECRCAACCPPRPALPPARPDRLALAMKKEAQDCSILATKSMRMSSASASAQLPGLPETPRAARSNHAHSVKMRRACSLHCWLPDPRSRAPSGPAPVLAPDRDLTPDDPHAYIRANNGLSVLGCAIIPELKPRVPTMSERDLTRVYTPRHYLRS